MNIVKIANFLNDFDTTMRSKLSNMNERLMKLERTVEHCEAVCASTLASQKQQN
jgi:hypothetical protein